MDNQLSILLENFWKNESGVSEAVINLLKDQIQFDLPADYINLMREFNGGEGEIGENGWLCLFPLEDLIFVNNSYILLMEQIPDYFLFGKDAADTGYAFHKTEQTIHAFGLMSDFTTDTIEFCGDTFLDFLNYLYNL
jgi:hypothetical protein